MLKRTPLYEIHKKLGARIVEFGGWEMPVTYPEGVLAEHRRVRSGVGLFDICHMGEILVTGAGAEGFINHLTTNDIRKIGDGGCQYAACCYENGTVVDDIISYRYNPEKYFVIVNASNTDKDFEWFKQHAPAGIKVENVSPHYCQLALQGPMAEKVLQPLLDFPLNRLAYYHFGEGTIKGTKVIVSRTGYTGEDGFEIYGAWDQAPFLWETLMAAGREFEIAPIGLAARDTLRLEAAYSLYGHEISDSINPLEARLAWIVKLDKKEFIGKESLEKISREGVKRKIVGIEMVDVGIPRQGFEVFSGDKKLGYVTSGTFSPTLEKAIALCLIDATHAAVGTELAVQVRKQKLKAKVISLPFYKRK